MGQIKPVVLVTGGCGYIGSHVCCLLSEAGYGVVVVDNLSSGRPEALLHGEKLVVGDCGDSQLLTSLWRQYEFSAVLHFAASIVVPESLQKPLEYYQNNVATTLTLLRVAQAHRLQHFILSSSAAVYGEGEVPFAESAPTRPLHAYGRSKLIDEWMLHDLGLVSPLSYVVLRYFNVAGADSQLRIGQSSPQPTHLIKIAAEVAVGKRSQLTVYGRDYPSQDGTCVRDYVHVEDLARAHLAALAYLEEGGKSVTLNCGYNRGYSVLEVLAACQEVLGRPLPYAFGARRAGDVTALVAKADAIREVLRWQPRYQSLATIVASAFAWEEVQQRRQQHR